MQHIKNLEFQFYISAKYCHFIMLRMKNYDIFHLNNYFDFHVCLSIRPFMLLSVWMYQKTISKLLAFKVGVPKKKSAALAILAEVCASA